MTEAEIQLLKESVDELVELETDCGERLIAKVTLVMHSSEYGEHDVQYKMISTNKPEAYVSHAEYVLDFDRIVAVRPHLGEAAKS